jgi:hypothetical protein
VHRLAGNPDRAVEGLVQLQDQENSARHGNGRDHQSEDSSSIARRERAEAEENHHQSGNKDDQTGAVTVPTEVSQDETFYITEGTTG